MLRGGGKRGNLKEVKKGLRYEVGRNINETPNARVPPWIFTANTIP